MHRPTESLTTSVSAAEHQLVSIDPNEMGQVWDILEPLMFKVIEGCNGRHTMQTLIAEIMSQELALWGVIGHGGLKAIVGTQIGVEPSGLRKLAIRFTVGKHMPAWIGLLDDLEEYARSVGCNRIEAYARKGYAKHMPDYKMTHVMLEKDLV